MVQPSACRRVASGSGGSSGSSGAGVGARATPQGRDKSSQKKSKGRWMLHEHEQFIVGLGEFGRDWKAIGEIVRTRTAVQIRTHAQKYFQQMEKGRCFPEEPYKSVDGECTADSQAAEPSSSSSGPNPTLSSAPEHGGARTTNRPDHKPSSLSSSLPSSLSSPSSSSASSASLALAAPTAALLAPQFQARVKAEGAPHHPTRRAILTTPAGERGKRLTRPSGPCTVAAVPRATRASSAAAAAAIVAATSATAAATAAAIANPATDGNGTDGATVAESDGPFVGASGDDCDVRHLREGHRGEGGGGDGDDFRGGDGKRRKLDRPPSADIVMAAAAAGAGDGGGMREAMEAAGGSIFAISHPGWLDQRFRGKRSLVSGTSGGLDLAEVEAGAGGYARVGLQVDVDLGGMYSDPPIMLSPTFRKADGGSPPWSMIGNMEEGEAGAAAVISEAGVHGLVGWRSDVGSPSCHKSPLFSDTFLEDFLVGGGAKDSPDSGDDDPPPPPSPPLPPPLCASSSSISCSSSTSSNSSSSLSSISISPSASSFPSEAPSSSCPAAGSREFLSKPYTVGSFSATAAAGTAATAAVTPSNICSPSALPSATGKQQRSTSRAAAATPTSCEGFGYGFAVGPDDCVVARHDSDGGFSLDTMPIPLGGAHHEMASNGILGGSHGSPFPQKQDAPWGVSTAGGDGRVGGYAGGDFDDHAVFAAIHGSGRGGEGGGGGDGATGPSSGTGVGSGASASAGNTGMNPSRQIDFLPFQHQQQSAPSPAGSMLGRAKGAVAAATALSLSEQQAAVVAAAVHDRFAASVGEAARESAALQSSLGGRGGIEDGPLCGNWLSYEDIGDGIGAGQDRLGMEADDAEALETLFAFEDHFGML